MGIVCFSLARSVLMLSFIFFFFQAEDGIRDRDVTGVQTCALPISTGAPHLLVIGGPSRHDSEFGLLFSAQREADEIGRASCRERVVISAVEGAIIKERALLAGNEVSVMKQAN